MCGPLSAGLSGGDLHALRLVQRWNEREDGNALILAPDSVRENAPGGGSKRAFRVVRTPLDRWLGGLVSYAAVVALRTVAAAVKAPPARFAIAASHFPFDVIPVLIHRIRYRSLPVVYVYHLIADMHRSPSLRSRLSAAGERLSLALMRRAGAVVFVDNEDTLESLARHGIERSLLLLTRNAYDPDQPLPPRTRGTRPSVLFVGRFTEEKGIWDMLELCRALEESVPDARVTMFGDGPQRREFMTRLGESGLQNVEAPGFVEEAEKWRALRAATVFAAPSREEGWGIAVGEALTAAVPVVAYDLPAYSHFGDMPLRVKPGDLEGFIQAVVDLVTDPSRIGREEERIRRGSAALPSWNEILDEEIAGLAAR